MQNKTYTEVYYEDGQEPESDLSGIIMALFTFILLGLVIILAFIFYSKVGSSFVSGDFGSEAILGLSGFLLALLIFLAPLRVDSRSSVSLLRRSFWVGLLLFLTISWSYQFRAATVNFMFEPLYQAIFEFNFYGLPTFLGLIIAFAFSSVLSGRKSIDPNYEGISPKIGWFIFALVGVAHLFVLESFLNSVSFVNEAKMNFRNMFIVGTVVSWILHIARKAMLERKVKVREESVEEVKNVAMDSNKDFSFGETIRRLTHESSTEVNDVIVKKAILKNHQMIFGTTGWGKTYGVLEPQVFHGISRGLSTLIFDPKGDVGFRDFVFSSCVESGRRDDFFYFSLTEKRSSNRFNPFKGLSKNEVKDVILASTDWSEPHYRKLARTALMNALSELHDNPTISDVLERIPKSKDLAGIRADLEAFKMSFGELIDHRGALGLIDLQQSGKVCFFSIDIQALPDEAPQLFRLLLCALNVVSLRAQRQMESERKDTLIVVDECGGFITNEFVEFLNKARSSKMRTILSTQTPHDFKSEQICNRVLDLTNVKVIGRVMEGSSREKLSKLVGTHTMLEHTHSRVEGGTSGRSTRKVKHLICHMDEIKQFPQGVGIVMVSEPFTVNKVSFSRRGELDFKIYSYSDYLKMKQSEKEKGSMSQQQELNESPIDWEDIYKTELEKAKRRVKELEALKGIRAEAYRRLGVTGLDEINEAVKRYVRDDNKEALEKVIGQKAGVTFNEATRIFDMNRWIEVEREKLDRDKAKAKSPDSLIPPKTKGKGVDDLFQ